jgi:hypothetical protein
VVTIIAEAAFEQELEIFRKEEETAQQHFFAYLSVREHAATFPDGVSISSEETYPTIAEATTAAAMKCPSVWRHSTEQARDQRLFASSMSTLPWHASGAHQQTRSRPRSSSSAFISSDCVTIHARYFAMTSAREPSRQMTNGLPHLLGRPM